MLVFVKLFEEPGNMHNVGRLTLKWFLGIFIVGIFALNIMSQCSDASSPDVCYYADFKDKSIIENSIGIIGGINMHDNDTFGLYLNKRAVAESDTCTYHSDGDYIDVEGNELHFKTGNYAGEDLTIGFKMNMGTKKMSSSLFSALSVMHRVYMDLDDDGILESFLVKDSLNDRQDIIRNYYGDNKIIVYSYVGGVLSYKELDILNTSWYEAKIQVCFREDDSDILYDINIYINNKHYGTIEIPQNITVAEDVQVECSSGKTVTVSDDCDISGLGMLNFLTSYDTLVKDVYIHSGSNDYSKEMIPVNNKTDVFGELLIDEPFNKKIKSSLILNDFDKAECNVTNNTLELYYSGDGKNTSKDMAKSPTIRMVGNGLDKKYVFKAKYSFNDFKIERNLAQLVFDKDGVEYFSVPILKTAYSNSMSKSKFVVSYLDGSGNEVKKEADISNQKWYNIEISVDLTGEYTAYNIVVIDNTGKSIINEFVEDKTLSCTCDNVYMQMRMDSNVEQTNALSGSTTMYVDDIYWASLSQIERLRVDSVKLFANKEILEKPIGNQSIKVSAFLSNYDMEQTSGTIFVCQFSADKEMLDISKLDFMIPGMHEQYAKYGVPTSEAVSLDINIRNGAEYIKLFVVDSTGEIIPYTKCLEYHLK